jgi:hypothetical protein
MRVQRRRMLERGWNILAAIKNDEESTLYAVRMTWVNELEHHLENEVDRSYACEIRSAITRLRRQCARPSDHVGRAQTRERVGRYRERKRASP